MPKLNCLCSFVVLLLATAPLVGADLDPDQVVAKHLDSIGSPAARAGVKSRVVQGSARFKMIVGGGGELEGKGGLVSEQHKFNFVLKFNNDYRGEQMVTDGDKAYVAATLANHRRSNFAELVHSQDFVIKEGLLGGELSTGWALLNLDPKVAKVEYGGLKKFDGKEVLDLRYRSKKHDDMNVHIYLDPGTFHHVATVYTIALASNLAGPGEPNAFEQTGLAAAGQSSGADVTQSAKQREIRYTIEERFGDFRAADGLTLPTTYDIRFTQELQNGSTNIYEWTISGAEISNNVGLDPRNFQMK